MADAVSDGPIPLPPRLGISRCSSLLRNKKTTLARASVCLPQNPEQEATVDKVSRSKNSIAEKFYLSRGKDLTCQDAGINNQGSGIREEGITIYFKMKR